MISRPLRGEMFCFFTSVRESFSPRGHSTYSGVGGVWVQLPPLPIETQTAEQSSEVRDYMRKILILRNSTS